MQQQTKLPSIQSMLEGIEEDKIDITIPKDNINRLNKLHLTPLEPLYIHSSLHVPPHRSNRSLHSRSFSDYTHPYPNSSPPHASGTQLAPIHQHRRAISTNSLDFILQPSTSIAHSVSDSDETEKKVNKYSCPYCQKGFSRPSSLRIHTYSHTGERPFGCPEKGCDRKFSVQSNMRRHVRVHHRLNKPLKRPGKLQNYPSFSNPPLIASKPSTTLFSWVGVYPS